MRLSRVVGLFVFILSCLDEYSEKAIVYPIRWVVEVVGGS